MNLWDDEGTGGVENNNMSEEEKEALNKKHTIPEKPHPTNEDIEKYNHPDCPHPPTKEWNDFCTRHINTERRAENEINMHFASDVIDLILRYYQNTNVNYYDLVRNLNLAFLSVVFMNMEKRYNIKTPPYKVGEASSTIANFVYSMLDEMGVTKTKLPKSYVEGLK